MLSGRGTVYGYVMKIGRLLIPVVVIAILVVATWYWQSRQTETVVTNNNPSTNQSVDVKLYMVAVGDNGTAGPKIGCGDSLVPVDQNISVPKGSASATTAASISGALKRLFAVRDQHYGDSGLYNALYQSQIAIGEVTFGNDTATVPLSGSFRSGGTCDDPRIIEQITATVKQFPEVKTATITFSGKPLAEALSQKGE